ncbi:hypothetical protein DFH07DRAFT_1029255 [Mycena maculata]|uniref:Uncharacterized protein n=1 Tax=Mycena maculata TaxID=230809 RepID=A0AAD7J077_9AGAR|nr:hypothetical protein DFH07DRAFT_1029255 [Mycena maculata]
MSSARIRPDDSSGIEIQETGSGYKTARYAEGGILGRNSKGVLNRTCTAFQPPVDRGGWERSDGELVDGCSRSGSTRRAETDPEQEGRVEHTGRAFKPRRRKGCRGGCVAMRDESADETREHTANSAQDHVILAPRSEHTLDRLQSRRPSPRTTLLSARIPPTQRMTTLEAGTPPQPKNTDESTKERARAALPPHARGHAILSFPPSSASRRLIPPTRAPPLPSQIHIHARIVYGVQVSDFAALESLPAHCRTAGVDQPLCLLGERGRRKTGAASETERMGNPRDHGQGRTRPLQTMSMRPTSGTGVCLEEDHGNTTRRPPRAPEMRHQARLESAVTTMYSVRRHTLRVQLTWWTARHELGVASKKRSGAPCRRGGTKTGHVLGSRGARRETGWCYTRTRECPMSNISISSTREGDYRGPMMRTSTTNDEHEVHIATAACLPSESGAKRRRRPNRARETRHRAHLEPRIATAARTRGRHEPGVASRRRRADVAKTAEEESSSERAGRRKGTRRRAGRRRYARAHARTPDGSVARGKAAPGSISAQLAEPTSRVPVTSSACVYGSRARLRIATAAHTPSAVSRRGGGAPRVGVEMRSGGETRNQRGVAEARGGVGQRAERRAWAWVRLVGGGTGATSAPRSINAAPPPSRVRGSGDGLRHTLRVRLTRWIRGSRRRWHCARTSGQSEVGYRDIDSRGTSWGGGVERHGCAESRDVRGAIGIGWWEFHPRGTCGAGRGKRRDDAKIPPRRAVLVHVYLPSFFAVLGMEIRMPAGNGRRSACGVGAGCTEVVSVRARNAEVDRKVGRGNLKCMQYSTSNGGKRWEGGTEREGFQGWK